MSGVVALIRFSFLPESDSEFEGTRHQDLSRRASVILAEKRLAHRFRVFEAICLPSLLAQPADRFTAVLLTSADLPAPYADRLRRLLASHPNLHACFAAPATTAAAMVEAAAEHGPGEGMRLTVRLDDDDALAANFTDRVWSYVQPNYDGHCLTLLKGLGLCRLYGRIRLWEREKPFVSAGMGLITQAGADRTIYDCGSHNRVAETWPTLIDASFRAYLQTTHRSNDSDGHIPASAYLRPGATMGLETARDLYGDSFPWLSGTDFGFL